MERKYIDYDWQLAAACKGVDVNAYYAKHGRTNEQYIFGICDGCPVFKDCLDHALKFEEYGYWAKTGPRERVAMREELGIELVNINWF
jgi:hypothetical protein